MFEGHATITVQEGIYSGISIHIRIVFPLDYPLEPPAAFIADNFPFTHKHHEHVHSGGSICCDLTSNFKFFFRQEERSGWSSACSLSALLMQLGSFFSDPDLPPKYLPSELDIQLLRNQAATFMCTRCSMDEDDINNMTCEPMNVENPNSIMIKSTEPIISQSVIEATELLRRLSCGVSKSNLSEDPSMVIGYPMLLERDRFGNLQLKQLILETISYDAYIMEIMRGGYDKIDFYESTQFVSPSGQCYNYWMPIYINENHFRRSFETIKNCICIIKFGSARGFKSNDFLPEYALESLCCLINKTVVSMLNGSLHESTKAIEAYCHMLRLLMAFLTVFPRLQASIEANVTKFMQNDINRSKSNCGDMGEFIIQCFLSKQFTFDEVKPFLLQEYYARQILWMQKAGIETNCIVANSLQTIFNACKVSNQLLVFSIEASKTFIFQGVCSKLDARNGYAPDAIVNAFQNRIKEIKMKVTNFSFLVKVVGMPMNSPQQMVAFLTQSHNLSKKQGYTRK